ncbi:MAG TPA: hypothetical protein VM306_00160 [Lentzea sp.]|nr:hypothetical protein [Lentzea sp.]
MAAVRFITACSFMAMMGPGSATLTDMAGSFSALSDNVDAEEAAQAWD